MYDARRYASAAQTGSDGHFALLGVFAEGLEFTVRAAGHATLTVRPVDRTSPLTVQLQPTGMLRGKVVDVHGKPVAGYVSATFAEGPEPVAVLSDGERGFELTRVAPGRVHLSAFSWQGGRCDTQWDTPPEEPVTLTLQPLPARSFAVRAEDAGGRPVREFAASAVWYTLDHPATMAMGEASFKTKAADGVALLYPPPRGLPDRQSHRQRPWLCARGRDCAVGPGQTGGRGEARRQSS